MCSSITVPAQPCWHTPQQPWLQQPWRRRTYQEGALLNSSVAMHTHKPTVQHRNGATEQGTFLDDKNSLEHTSTRHNTSKVAGAEMMQQHPGPCRPIDDACQPHLDPPWQRPWLLSVVDEGPLHTRISSIVRQHLCMMYACSMHIIIISSSRIRRVM
jgi:hypothetical protein